MLARRVVDASEAPRGTGTRAGARSLLNGRRGRSIDGEHWVAQSTDRAAQAWIKSYPKGLDWNMALRGRAAVRAHRGCRSAQCNRPLHHLPRPHPDLRGDRGLGRQGRNGPPATRRRKGHQELGFSSNTPTFVVYYFAVLKAGAWSQLQPALFFRRADLSGGRTSETESDDHARLSMMLFDKVEHLIAQKTLKGAVVCSFGGTSAGRQGQCCSSSSRSGRSWRGRALLRCGQAASRERGAGRSRRHSSPWTSTPSPIAPCRNTRVARRGRSKARCSRMPISTVTCCRSRRGRRTSSTAGEVARRAAVLPRVRDDGGRHLGVRCASELFLMPRFVLNDALDLIHKNRLTVLAGVPALFNATFSTTLEIKSC